MAELRSDIVSLLLPEDKYFPVTRSHLCSMFERGARIDIPTTHQLPRRIGDLEDVEMRLRISGMLPYFQGWHITLLIQNTRVDGFGWEPYFTNAEGVEQGGWHRHLWCPKKKHADGKIGVKIFDVTELTFEKFLLWSLKEMHILLMKEATSDELYLDP